VIQAVGARCEEEWRVMGAPCVEGCAESEEPVGAGRCTGRGRGMEESPVKPCVTFPT
jgi:hypothetical protein